MIANLLFLPLLLWGEIPESVKSEIEKLSTSTPFVPLENPFVIPLSPSLPSKNIQPYSSPLTLQGFLGESVSINGTWVKEKETLPPWRVMKIAPPHVLLVHLNTHKSYTLTLKESR